MKTVTLIAVLSVVSCIVVVVIDYFLGPKAEFLNAYTAFERISGRESSVSDSFIFRQFGAVGEFVGVLIVSVLGGLVLTFFLRLVFRARSNAR